MATDIYGVTNGIKGADGVLFRGSHMVNVQKNLSPDPVEIIVLVWRRPGRIWGQVHGVDRMISFKCTPRALK